MGIKATQNQRMKFESMNDLHGTCLSLVSMNPKLWLALSLELPPSFLSASCLSLHRLVCASPPWPGSLRKSHQYVLLPAILPAFLSSPGRLSFYLQRTNEGKETKHSLNPKQQRALEGGQRSTLFLPARPSLCVCFSFCVFQKAPT